MAKLRWAVTLGSFLLLVEFADRAAHIVIDWIHRLGFPPGLERYAGAISAFLLLNAAVVWIEFLRPGSRPAPRQYLHGLAYSAVSLTAMLIAPWIVSLHRMIPATPLQLYLKDGAPEYVRLSLAALLIVAFAFFLDFFAYWYHRAQHRFGPLWRLHRVHHSLNPLNGLNSYQHIVDNILIIPVTTLPAAILQIDMPTVFILSAFISSWTLLIHMDTSINLGPLRALVIDTAAHRIHHSTNPEHFNSNFGTVCSLWDRLFGTYVEPKEGEWPNVGLEDCPAPATIRDYILMPFRAGR
jgi:sterol desaturase/sphingolipid hydroxylase (fatty acid hydroxylase superfamily)